MSGGTPKVVVENLNAEIRRVARSPDSRSLLEKQGLTPSDLTPQEVNDRARRDLAYWLAAVKPLGIRAG